MRGRASLSSSPASLPDITALTLEASGLADAVYVTAAAVFRDMSEDRAPAHISPAASERRVYALAFNAQKYTKLLLEILTNSNVYQHTPDHRMPLLLVLLYDLLDRKFRPRHQIKSEGEGLIQEVRDMENKLHRFRTKLQASLAHLRIQRNLITLDHCLPPAVRVRSQRSRTVPVCAWINTLKMSAADVCETLRSEGFRQVDTHTHLREREFCTDTHCCDVLLFAPTSRIRLEQSRLVSEHTLVLQDKSRSLLACVVGRRLQEDGGDVLVVGSFSSLTVSHVVVRATGSSGSVCVCGVQNIPAFTQELHTILTADVGRNVVLMSESFSELSEEDERLQKIKMILLLPRCSSTALTDPLDHILVERGDRELLAGLSKGIISQTKLKSLVSAQRRDLRRALSLPQVTCVMYCTCSVFPEENELLLERERTQHTHTTQTYRHVTAGLGDTQDNFFKLQPSDLSNGCFICVLRRESVVESAQDVLARAAAKGLLGGLTPSEPTRPRKKRKTRKTAASHARRGRKKARETV